MIFDPGLVQVYTGDGKGKTTAALGLAVRVCGHGGKVAFIQFMKGWNFYGEIAGLSFLPGVRHERTGTPDYVYRGKESEKDRAEAARGLSLAKECLASGFYDLVVLDEVNVAADYGLVDPGEAAEAIRKRPPHVEVVLTGRSAPEVFLGLADLVTEMREVRHPFKKGLASRRGSDF
ncbi:MAG TPA: cob(I)yrinic acid a,c-diamide adenosyltransferase [Synergistales bacterium]|jgi:cob(I)alamin adenosyltransferase|nr:cob(I)yrinic acid a,c-diamide adenosyltransferase [Synergistales bacterium]HRS49014.1 cob(I)yrinic acid a,c-diamide adenosyltransferase [Thermovirgaceae bacterium]HRU90925.1 cob(I)yrinic acid a,c-diamide adenosyltransferase [Thermovirgaceae bacterium]